MPLIAGWFGCTNDARFCGRMFIPSHWSNGIMFTGKSSEWISVFRLSSAESFHTFTQKDEAVLSVIDATICGLSVMSNPCRRTLSPAFIISVNSGFASIRKSPLHVIEMLCKSVSVVFVISTDWQIATLLFISAKLRYLKYSMCSFTIIC